jgi:hypothetical protein
MHKWMDAFLRRDGLNLLFCVSNPGTGKSNNVKSRLDKHLHRHVKAGRLTAFQLYKQIYCSRNRALILDDVEDALKRPDTAGMIMDLCETDEPARTIGWYGSESQLKVRTGKKIIAIPQEFDTSSRVCIICNNWKILTSKFAALLDRGTVVFFDPAPEEVHRFVGQWFEDEEIYSFIGNHLDEIPRPSIRFYVHAQEHKRHGLDWRAVLVESWTNEKTEENAPEKLIRQLIEDPTFRTDKERIEAFTANSNGRSRRMWFYLKRKLRL